MIEKKYILYGASFDPPHMGHYFAIQQMLEQYDKIIIFPYPHKITKKSLVHITPLKHRMDMLEIFLQDFFPQIKERLLLVNLSSELNQRDKFHDGFYHTYDYLNYLKTKIDDKTELSVCFGIDAKTKMEDNVFYNEEEIKKNFKIFSLEEEEHYKSSIIRETIQNLNSRSSTKTINTLKSLIGDSLLEYIINKKIYFPQPKPTQKVKMKK